MVHVDLLAQIPIFSGLDAANMEAIARVAPLSDVHGEAGTHIVPDAELEAPEQRPHGPRGA